MAKIVHKLNLNKTPQLVEDNSMIFAKNIMLGKDGTIRRDKAFIEILSNINNSLYINIQTTKNTYTLAARNLISKSYEDTPESQNEKIQDLDKIKEYTDIINSISVILSNNSTIGTGINKRFENFTIIEIIPYNTKFYVLCSLGVDSMIVEYDEITKDIKPYYTAWKYSGGNITGNCSINLRNEIILTIAESGAEIDVPLKTINLNKAKYTDDESWYTQTPVLDLFNLRLINKYSKSIPNGVYQFFARFEISENNYTNWFIVSNELFAGNNTVLHTHQGSINYINEHLDSDESFVFIIDKLKNTSNYTKVQLGFLLSHDNEIYARSWKTIDFNSNEPIYFDYNQENIKEIKVEDLLKVTYNIYNVKQITQFKNKQYISNYKETEFNPYLQGYADNIEVGIKHIDVINVVEDEYDVIISRSSGFSKTYKSKNVKIDESNNKLVNNLDNTHLNVFLADAFKEASGYGTPNEVDIAKVLDCKLGKLVVQTEYIAYNDVIVYELYSVTDEDVDIDSLVKEQHRFISADDKEYETSNIVEVLSDIIGNGAYIENSASQSILKRDDDDNIVIKLIKKYWTENEVGEEFPYTEHQRTYEFRIYFNTSVSVDVLQSAILSDEFNTYNTLIPEQEYELCVHFVKNTGETTNGYKLGGRISVKEGDTLSDGYTYNWHNISIVPNVIFIPTFNNIVIPSGYAACYFSIKHVENKFIQVCNIESVKIPKASSNTDDETTDSYLLLGQSIEHNLRLINTVNKKSIINVVERVPSTEDPEMIIPEFKTFNAVYKHSTEGSQLVTFGSSGAFASDEDEELILKNIDSNGYIIESYKSAESYNDFIKCTPYINEESLTNDNPIYEDYLNLTLLGSLNPVVLLNYNVDNYVSGGDRYEKAIGTSGDNKQLILSDSSFVNKTISQYNKINMIYSSYNLSYLALSEGTNFNPKTVTKTDTIEGQSITTKILAIATDSINLSDVYTLPKMYKEYTRYLCTKREDNTITKFDNTIRSSKLETDEDTLNRFIFEPTDYYNVPTTKGIITNLVAVGNAILVHTQDSLFKFVGNNTLTANGGEDVQLKESEVFDTGITEVFGSAFGYAGLKDKKHSIITELGYIFFDYDAKVLYLYAGEGQMSAISEPIDKLLKHANIQNVYFANDYYNDRFLISIVFNNNNVLEYATLSFNYKAKSFISLHDFKFNKSFSTKTKCYLLHTTENAIDKIIEYGTYEINSSENPIDTDFIIENDNLYPTYNIDNEGTIKASIVDIIFNTSYETIKALNTISWVCNNIIKFTEIGQDIDNIYNMAEENLNSEYKGDYLRLYTDTTATDLINLSGRSNDERLITQSVLNENSYKLPRYNKGRWNLNYFRNILNTTQAQFNKNNYRDSDNHSLIYGKYIVARFIFDNSVNDFKFENIEFNVSNYE